MTLIWKDMEEIVTDCLGKGAEGNTCEKNMEALIPIQGEKKVLLEISNRTYLKDHTLQVEEKRFKGQQDISK